MLKSTRTSQSHTECVKKVPPELLESGQDPDEPLCGLGVHKVCGWFADRRAHASVDASTVERLVIR